MEGQVEVGMVVDRAGVQRQPRVAGPTLQGSLWHPRHLPWMYTSLSVTIQLNAGSYGSTGHTPGEVVPSADLRFFWL